MQLTIHPGKLTRWLTAIVLVLIAASVACAVARYRYGHADLLGGARLFNLMEEANVPTWFSSVLLLICATWLWLIARLTKLRGERFARHWLALAAIFLLMSLDETAQVHDLVSDQLHDRLHTHGVLYYAWVIPAGAFLALIGLAYVRFLFALPRRTAVLFVLAGGIYVGGALGMEMVAAVYDESHGYENAITAAMANVEESMEMLGLVVFGYALLSYLTSTFGPLRIGAGAATETVQDVAAEGMAVRQARVVEVVGRRVGHP
jgi:hypothetical protein